MQEAVVVGLDKAGTKEDQIITAYRDHGHAVCRGSESKAVLAELLGKFTGVSKGKGGSMHMYSGTVAKIPSKCWLTFVYSIWELLWR